MNYYIAIVSSFIILIFPFIGRRRFSRVSLGNISISLGLLGTFIGILYGLVRFDTGNIPASFPALLEGLKIAFLSTMTGLFTSLLLKIFPFIYGLHRNPVADEEPEINRLLSLLSEINENMKNISPQPAASHSSSPSIEQNIQAVTSQLQQLQQTLRQTNQTLQESKHEIGFSQPDYEKLFSLQLDQLSVLVKNNEEKIQQRIDTMEEKRQQEIEQLKNFTDTLMSILKKLTQDRQNLHKIPE